MERDDEASWTRALMASSGLTVGHASAPQHASAALKEAGAASTSRERLMALAVHKDTDVRAEVARRADCPLGVMASLAHDRSQDVRCAVAGNPSLAPAVADYLRQDRASAVLMSLARNLATTPEVLRMLGAHRREEVRRAASRQLREHLARQGQVGADPDEALNLGLPTELHDRVSPQDTGDTTSQPRQQGTPRVVW